MPASYSAPRRTARDGSVDLPQLRNRVRVFRDRAHAGEVLADMLRDFRGASARVLAIPAGGVPVGAVIARRLELPLAVAVVSKITLPWNSEMGYGAVAFDGTVRLNDELIERLALGDTEVRKGIAATREKVQQRLRLFQADDACAGLDERPLILVDDGLASGITLLAAIEALSKAGASRLIVAVPTGHDQTVERIGREVEAIYCPNIREGRDFAVAEAYQQWRDVAEDAALQLLQAARGGPAE